MDIVRFGQQLLTKAVLDRTKNGTELPSDMGEVQSLLRDLTANAQITRKLDIEENGSGDARIVAEAYREHKRLREQEAHPTRTSDSHPIEEVTPPKATLLPGEGDQGQQLQLAEDYMDPE